MNASEKQKNVLIVGAGIAGLSLARQFRKLDIPYKIIEKRSDINIQGFGIALPANAVKALRYLGLGNEIDTIAHRVDKIIYAKSSGQLLSQSSLTEAPLIHDHFVALTRGKLIRLLLQNFQDEIYFNTSVNEIVETAEGVHIKFNSNSLPEETFSAVIGADGLNSSIRELAFGKIPLLDLGYTTWRWISKYSKNIDPIYMLDAQDSFMAYPIGDQQVYCYAHVVDPDQQWVQQQDPQQILKIKFAQYQGIAKELLQHLPNNLDIMAGRLQSVPYPFFAKDRIALVGDAGNACSPMLQQGAASAFEDVIALSELLHCFPIQKAFKYYEAFRKERVIWIVESSDKPLKRFAKKQSFITLFLRDQFIKRKGPINVQGWKHLLKSCPIEEIPRFIEQRL